MPFLKVVMMRLSPGVCFVRSSMRSASVASCSTIMFRILVSTVGVFISCSFSIVEFMNNSPSASCVLPSLSPYNLQASRLLAVAASPTLQEAGDRDPTAVIETEGEMTYFTIPSTALVTLHRYLTSNIGRKYSTSALTFWSNVFLFAARYVLGFFVVPIPLL